MIDPQDIIDSVREFPDLPPTPQQTIEGIVAAENAQKAIKQRSFSGRHPELGKMIKCQVCKARHRASQKCVQVFAKDVFGTEQSLANKKQTLKGVVGAAAFKGKRIKPHFNKRAKAFIELVRALVPDEYTKEELEKARNIAKRILAAKYGRYGFLPPAWKKFPIPKDVIF